MSSILTPIQLVVVVVSLMFQGCFASSLCSDEISSEVVSPDQNRIAKTFVRSCGATTGWVTHVEMRWLSSKSTSDDLVFTITGKPDVHVKWLDDLTLFVDCQGCGEEHVSRRVSKLGKVTIRSKE